MGHARHINRNKGVRVLTPQERADKSSDALWSDDQASHWMGIERGEVSEGHARMSLAVQKHHCNGHGICHGGVIFTLADTAFAFACNSRNQNTVAQNNMVTFIAPGQVGDVLTATAREVSLAGRSGIYDVRVTKQDGTLIAEMRGLSRAIKGQLFVEAGEGE
jgi:acyl-CoA thioesterase